MMRDDADDVDADGAEHNVGDNDGLFFSLAWRRRTGTCRKERGLSRVVTGTLNARRGDRQRQVRQAALSPWVPREWPLAYLLVVQAMGVFHQVRQRRVGFGFLRSPQRSAVGGTRCTGSGRNTNGTRG